MYAAVLIDDRPVDLFILIDSFADKLMTAIALRPVRRRRWPLFEIPAGRRSYFAAIFGYVPVRGQL